jgi:ribA/ribD-fused uncharacterized protein
MKIIGPFTNEYRFLSNFWPAKVILYDTVFPSVEHAYQAAKSINYVNDFLGISAGQAKRLARSLYLRPDWEEVKVPIMMGLLAQKFAQETLRKKLLDTNDDTLVELNNWGDVFWGVCNGKGQNVLGNLLMKVRKFYRESYV